MNLCLILNDIFLESCFFCLFFPLMNCCDNDRIFDIDSENSDYENRSLSYFDFV